MLVLQHRADAESKQGSPLPKNFSLDVWKISFILIFILFENWFVECSRLICSRKSFCKTIADAFPRSIMLTLSSTLQRGKRLFYGRLHAPWWIHWRLMISSVWLQLNLFQTTLCTKHSAKKQPVQMSPLDPGENACLCFF